MSTEPSAKVIADSITPDGHRLTTMEVVMHRFILAEFNTHRAFSRNSASSRAIPVHRQLKRVVDDPAIPVLWASEKSGMQGGEPLGHWESKKAEHIWREARAAAVRAAEDLVAVGVHKSITNRLLEPFMWHTVIVSSTEWQNFFAQRCSPLAQPEIQAAAVAMRTAWLESDPAEKDISEWHLPYMTEQDIAECEERSIQPVAISAARCARVSYLTHDGQRDLDKDLELYNRLTSAVPPHASPLEHVATPRMTAQGSGKGNFTGWMQLRHLVWKE